jgi:Zn-dependent peptidase ImmA (M78 family)
MEPFLVTIGKEEVVIDKRVFESLLDLSPIKEYKDYIHAINNNRITLEKLKKLAQKAGVPYPLFFAPKTVCDEQLSDKNNNLFQKISSKDEIRLSSRGKIELEDIELIVKDLARKQEFLKRRIVPQADVNGFVGSFVKKMNQGYPLEQIAKEIREYFGIDLNYLRTISKDKVLNYLRNCIEGKGILVAFSSHNYMPQNLNKELELSGICIKDPKFPYVFINTRDGDDKPKIIESSGRQIFTLLTMVACVGMNKFILSSKSGKSKNDISKVAFQIASEVVIPREHLNGIQITSLNDLKEKSHLFRVTPSMLLYQLRAHKKVDKKHAESYWIQLKQEVKKTEPKHKHAPLPVTGYSKYNGERFSREVVRAHIEGRVSHLEVKNILFRRGKKMDSTLWNKYIQKYKSLS